MSRNVHQDETKPLKDSSDDDREGSSSETKPLVDWKWHHTASLFSSRMITMVLGRSIFLFNNSLSDALGISILQFEAVIIAYYVGNIIAGPIGSILEKSIHNTVLMFGITTYTCGVTAIFFGIPFIIVEFEAANTIIDKIVLLTYFSIVYFIFGTCYTVSNSIAYAFVSEYAPTIKQNKIVAIFASSYTIASFWYVIEGYLIDVNASLLYILLGLITILISFTVTKISFASVNNNNNTDSKIHDNPTKSDDDSESEQLQQLADDEVAASTRLYIFQLDWLKQNKTCTMLLICSFFIGIPNGCYDVLVNPTLMKIYGMSTFMSGVCSMCVAGGEVLSSIISLVFFSDGSNTKPIIMLGWVCLIIRLTIAVLLLIFVEENDLSLYLFLTFTLFWYFALELMFYVQVSTVVKCVETKEITSNRLLLLTFFVVVYSARALGTIVGNVIWDWNENHKIDALSDAAISWIVCLCIGILFWLKFFQLSYRQHT